MTIDLEALLKVHVDIVTSGALSAALGHRRAMAAEILAQGRPM